MTKLGRYKIPKPFKDEDKWFRFFTKKQLLYIGIAGFISIRIFINFLKAPFLLRLVSTIFCAVIMLGAVLFGMAKVPEDKYLMGGGVTVERFCLRLLRKCLPGNKVLYVKHYHYHAFSDKEIKLPWK